MSTAGGGGRLPLTVPTYERHAERLLDAVRRAACEGRLGFAAQVEAALRATLELFAAEPQLARDLLIVPPNGGAGEETARCQRRWFGRYGNLLRGAAADSVRGRRPDILEPTLIGGVVSMISREVAAGESERLLEMLPALLEFLLVFYLAPEEAGSRAAAARPATGGLTG